MQRILRSAGAGLLATTLMASGAAYAQTQAAEPAGKTAGKTDVEIGHIRAEESVERLQEAVDQLRQASVLMLRQEAGPDREAAVEAAQEALILTQRAMLQLPPEMRVADRKIRDAKDWPLAMARLDEATQELRAAVDAVSKQAEGEARDKAVGTMHEALQKTQQAMAEIPEPDAGAAMTTGAAATTTGAAATAAGAQAQAQQAQATPPGIGRMPEREGGAPLPSERQPDGDAAAVGLTEGADVVNAQGEKIGEVKAVEGDRVIVSVGGFLGMGARDVALERNELRISGTGEQAQLQTSLTQEELEKLPAYEGAPGIGRMPEREGGAPLPDEGTPPGAGSD